MNYCAHCGTPAGVSDKFCGKCGAQANVGEAAFIEQRAEFPKAPDDEEELKIFVGKKYEYFRKKWMATDAVSSNRSWNWAGFFLNLYWLTYRKMYGYAAIFLSISWFLEILLAAGRTTHSITLIIFSVILSIFSATILGLYGNALYRRHANKKIASVTAEHGVAARAGVLSRRGGTNIVAALLLAVGYACSTIFFDNFTPAFITSFQTSFAESYTRTSAQETSSPPPAVAATPVTTTEQVAAQAASDAAVVVAQSAAPSIPAQVDQAASSSTPETMPVSNKIDTSQPAGQTITSQNAASGYQQYKTASENTEPQTDTTNCATAIGCAKAMLVFAKSENLAGAMQAASTVDSFTKPQRGDRATARKLNQDGLAALNASNPDEAVKLLVEANQADPGDEEIISNLAYAYSADGQLAKSEDTAVLALSLNPRRTSVWAPLAVTLAKEGRGDQAVEAMWLAFQFSGDKQKTLSFIDARLAAESDPAVLKMYTESKAWLTQNQRPAFN